MEARFQRFGARQFLATEPRLQKVQTPPTYLGVAPQTNELSGSIIQA